MSSSSFDEKERVGRGHNISPAEIAEAAQHHNTLVTQDGAAVNASGHRDQLTRQYGLLSVCGLAITIDNAWVALGGSLTVSILNGGAPGIIYEFLVACFYYAFIAASIAELASAIPSSGGVYHWASVTPGKKWGRTFGFFAGWLNFFGWIFDLASIVSIPAKICVEFYRLYHPDLVVQPWHTYVAFLGITWICCALCIFGNKLMPYLEKLGLFLVVVGGLVTIIVVAAMPKVHATNDFVWKVFVNSTGWGDGVAFLTGVLNGAFTIGTCDSVSHMAEELPNPRVDLPKAIFAQIILGTITGFVWVVAVLYGISDLDSILSSPAAFPLSAIYEQATGSPGAAFGLLFIVFMSIIVCVIGTFLTVGRIWWSLARDNAVPFAGFFSNVNERLSCPIPATVLCAILNSAFGAIALGSSVGFNDLVGSFIVLTSVSYVLAILPHLLTGRKNVPQGPFWMGKYGYVVNALSVIFIVFFDIMFCFPYAMPVTPQTMNYNSVILVGCFVLALSWWFIHGRRNYPGPILTGLYIKTE
ncbi:choline transport protein [Myriangium duriaei CBS 260.36]|uniref:Choline transport protein n=1 Tax=Myriangium duriaei CBS 260.36 TaxID=1168546 RepID=A0A9P4J8F5_9PEZI|nr:choline transport protein [Myriangium duriaei CBS 260.36]